MQQLDDYMSSLPKVRIVRAPRREGLIRARLLGARYVTAPVLTYLDSHCECTEGIIPYSSYLNKVVVSDLKFSLICSKTFFQDGWNHY